MKLHRMFCLLWLALIVHNLEAQNPSNIIPPSPAAQQFHKYGDYPVGHFTGVPEISIPLYTIKEGDLELPISLSYHASGIKPSDQSGILGLGWTLMVGGRVSKTVVGQGDGYNGSFQNIDASTINPTTDLDGQIDGFTCKSFNSEYDIYSYGVNDMFGKFLFKPESDLIPVLYPYKPLKVEAARNNGSIQYFNITDPNGIFYRFGQSLDGVSYEEIGESESYLLTDMVSAINPSNTIKMKYVAGPLQRSEPRHDTYIIDDAIYQDCWWGVCYHSYMPYDYQDGKYSFTMTAPDEGVDWETPSEITFRNGKITFVYNADKMIDNINVFDLQGSLVLKIGFERTTFSGTMHEGNYRYKLTALKFYDRNNQFVNQYRFGYNHENEVMPDERTPQLDFWGYFNNKNSGVSVGYPSSYDANYFPKWNNNTIIDLTTEYPIKGIRTFNGSIDRTADENYMKYYTLENIIYPTGGSTTFQYQANRYKDPSDGTIRQAGGLRVSTIINKDENSNITGVKTYQYFDNQGNEGAGNIEVIPNPDIYQYNMEGYFVDPAQKLELNFRRRIFTSDPTCSLAPHGSPVVYTHVNEYTYHGYLDASGNLQLTDPIGRTEYYYNYEPSSYGNYSMNKITQTYSSSAFTTIQKPFLEYEKEWGEGQLLGKYTYDKNNILVESTVNTYQENIREQVRGMHFYPFATFVPDPENPSNMVYSGIIGQVVNYSNHAAENYANYWTVIGESKLMNTTTTRDGVTTSTQYVYDNATHIQPTQEITTNSKGETITTVLKYPHEMMSDLTYPNRKVCTTMVNDRHIWSPVIRQTESNGATPLTMKQTDYQNWIIGSTNIIAPQYIATYQNGATWPINNITFSTYDNQGNILSLLRSDNIQESYYWGYNQTHPVVKAENMDNATLAALVSQSLSGTGYTTMDDLLTSITSFPNSNWSTFNQNLRSKAPNALITTYTYKQLTGITSSVDPGGVPTYYNYDNFGRLSDIKDKDGNVLKHYEYNYNH